MNKYIRTKDGKIYQVYDKVFDYKGDKRYQLINSRFEISLSDVVKEADTIEELCDGYVVEDKYNPAVWFIMEAQEFINEKEHLKNWSYKAFIKTDKGLIYVAKMNEEGKLELL